MQPRLAPLLTAALLPQFAAAQQPPNIILFLVDDMGWQETSVPFYKERTPLNDRYRTPNMERLARQGVKFTRAYACPVSSPSRCSLLTGMNAARHRVTNWVGRYNQDTNAPGGNLTLPQWSWNGIQPATTTHPDDLPNSTLATTLPQLLSQAGYHTIHCGKGNFGAGYTSGANPANLGFHVNIAGSGAGCPESYLAADNYGTGFHHIRGLERYYRQGLFLTEALTREALRAMDTPISQGKPFFLYMSHYAIHTPYQADQRFTPNYQNSDHTGLYDPLLGEPLNSEEINHAALLEGMDRSLGDIMDYLQRRGIAHNTIIIFMSDNGGQAIAPRQGMHNRLQNYPARGGKGSAYDGGVHEPMIVSWQGVVRGGTENHNLVAIEDFFPTILQLAGIHTCHTLQTVDGQSLMPLLRQPLATRQRAIVTHYPNRWVENFDIAEGYGTYSAIISGDYHLIYSWEDRSLRLYNLMADPGEQTDLASRQPQLTRQLAAQLSDSLRAYHAQRPSPRGKARPVPWPDGRK